MEIQLTPTVEETNNPDDYQHAVHDCQINLMFGWVNYPAKSMCGETIHEREPGTPKRPKCPKCLALQGTVLTCPGCGETGLM